MPPDCEAAGLGVSTRATDAHAIQHVSRRSGDFVAAVDADDRLTHGDRNEHHGRALRTSRMVML
jgi:hypothetical protein